MNNALRYSQGELTIRLGHLLDDMSDADKLDLIDRLSCEDAIARATGQEG